MTSNISRQLLATSDSPGCVSLETITINTKVKDPSFGVLRAAIEFLFSIVENDIRIERPYSDYDCTGQSFTNGLDKINWFTYDTGEECLLIAIYKHYISVDV